MRSWELEISRGIAEAGEAPEESARRELLEETGLVADELVALGEIAPDTGQSSGVVSVFFANVKETVQSKPEEREAIASVIFLTQEELWTSLKNGYLQVSVNGQEKKLLLRDPFLTFALVQMQVRGLLA